MILGDLSSFAQLVVDRHDLQRGRWDGGRAFDIVVYIGPLGLHLLWPGLRQSYINRRRKT